MVKRVMVLGEVIGKMTVTGAYLLQHCLISSLFFNELLLLKLLLLKLLLLLSLIGKRKVSFRS